MAEIKAIETEYNGYKFRSRLEARWAVFFDALGVKYEYEPEGFDLGDGDYYLPDFKVKCYGTRGRCDEEPFDLWIEVKGKMTPSDARKINKFANPHWSNSRMNCFADFLVDHCVLVVGNLPEHGREDCPNDPDPYEKMNGCDIYPYNYALIDGDYFSAYPAALNGKFYLWGGDGSYVHDTEIVAWAYDVARSARFEHGEKPFRRER